MKEHIHVLTECTFVDTYTLFAVRDGDLPDRVHLLMNTLSNYLRGRHMSYFIANGSYQMSDFGELV